VTTNRESGPPVVGVPTDPADATPTTTERPSDLPLEQDRPGDEVTAGTGDAREDGDETGHGRADDSGDTLPLEAATAYGVEGYDPDDPWNAVLCIESERAVTVLPLTPKSLGDLVSSLAEVQDAQRFALGVGEIDGGAGQRADRAGAFRNVAAAARFATGSAPVARLWQASTQGRLVIIGAVVLFVVIGIVASLFAR
jgi:hypothetical protein